MYQVSDEYKAKMLDQVQTHRLRGTLNGTISFTDNDVIGVSYSNQCSDKKVNVGSVYVGTLKLTFLRDFLNRGSYYGKTITISDGLLLGYDEHDVPVWEDVPIGTFYIADAVYRAEGMVDITAYDCLSLMDEPWQSTQALGTLYSYCKSIELNTGAVFGMTQEECEALPNGSESIMPSTNNEINTYRDLLHALAQFAGGFATATKDGTWVIKTYKTDPVTIIPKNRRFQSAKYSDYTTLYDGISYTDIQRGIERTLGPATGSIIELGANPFLQFGSVITKTQRCEQILNAVALIRYTPFSVSALPALVALDMGDVVKFTDDYTGGYTQGAVMQLSWTYNKSVQLQCFGENPKLASVQSQSRKSISSLRQSSADNEINYYHYSNLDDYSFGPETEVLVAKLRFTATHTTTIKIFHEIIMDMTADLSADCSYEVHYYLDGNLLPYKPYERIGGIYGSASGDTELSITKDLFYVLQNVTPNVMHTWEVKIIMHGISSTEIDVDHIHITLEGQKMYADDLSGFLEITDNLSLFTLGGLGLLALEDSAVIKINPVDEFNITTEDGDDITTEDGDDIIW